MEVVGNVAAAASNLKRGVEVGKGNALSISTQKEKLKLARFCCCL